MWRRTADDARSSVRRVRDLRVLAPAALESLATTLAEVERLCADGQAAAPSAGLDAPAGTAYGMANAHPDVLAAVDLVAPHHDDDGVAQVLEDRFTTS